MSISQVWVILPVYKSFDKSVIFESDCFVVYNGFLPLEFQLEITVAHVLLAKFQSMDIVSRPCPPSCTFA